MLTADQHREQNDSRPCLDVVTEGQVSPGAFTHFGGPSSSSADTPHYRALRPAISGSK